MTVLGENCQNIDAMKIAPNDDMQTARKKHGKLKIVWSSFGKGGKNFWRVWQKKGQKV